MTDPEEFTALTGLALADPETLDASAITPEVYAAWRAPRFGAANPERMNNPLWEWLVRTRMDPYWAAKKFNGPSSMDAGPGWCCDRMGQPFVKLPDGRLVFIAGEHEDHYDPDFCIYNDVIVHHPEGTLDIFGYPKEAFPPVDFHSATLAGDRIILIGNLGYMGARRHGQTHLAELDTKTWRVALRDAVGEGPGWLHDHTATLAEDGRSILVRGGIVDPGADDDTPLLENLDDWRLHLDNWRWERLTRRQWPRRVVRRRDCEGLYLFELRHQDHMPKQYMFENLPAELLESDPEFAEAIAELRALDAAAAEEILNPPKLSSQPWLSRDRSAVDQLYSPAVPHDPVPGPDDVGADENENSYKTRRLRVQGVIVRYVEEWDHIMLTAEGDLSSAVVDSLADDLRAALEQIQNVPCEVKAIPS
jgi:hypothetical protein